MDFYYGGFFPGHVWASDINAAVQQAAAAQQSALDAAQQAALDAAQQAAIREAQQAAAEAAAAAERARKEAEERAAAEATAAAERARKEAEERAAAEAAAAAERARKEAEERAAAEAAAAQQETEEPPTFEPVIIQPDDPQSEGDSPSATPGEDAPMDPNTPYQGYISNLPEVKENLAKIQEQIDVEYAKANREVIQACDALINAPEDGLSVEKVRALKRLAEQDSTLKIFSDNYTGNATILGWAEGIVEAFLDSQSHSAKDLTAYTASVFDSIRQTEPDKAALYELRHEIQRNNETIKKWQQEYNPKMLNAGQHKAALKEIIDENIEHRKTLGDIWAKHHAKVTPKLDDYPLTLSEQFHRTLGVTPEYAAEVSKSGNVKALAHSVRNMTKIQAVGVGATIAGFVIDAFESREDLVRALSSDGWNLVAKAEHFKENVGQTTWDKICTDGIDAAILAGDIAASAALTPLGGVLVGVALHTTGAFLKTLYYAGEYGYDNVDFGKTFLENMKLGNHEPFILKQDTEFADTDAYLNGYVQDVMLQGGVQEVMLQGYVQEVMLQGGVQDVMLQGYVQDVMLQGYVQNVMLQGSVQDVMLRGGVNYVTNLSNYAAINTNSTGDADFITNYALGTKINSAKGKDTINNSYASDVTIDSGADNDSVTNTAANVSINANAGDDFVKNTKYTSWDYTTHKWKTAGTSPNYAIIAGGAGNDSIENYGGQNVSINGGDGNDYIISATKPCDLPDPVVYVDEKPPTLDDDDDWVYAEAGSPYNDEVRFDDDDSDWLNETANAGAPVSNEGLEDDDDLVYEPAADEVDTDTPPDNATILGGNGDDYVGNNGAKSFISGGNDADTIYNSGEGVTILGDSGDDSIQNEGDYFYGWYNGKNVSISGGDGADTISNREADNVTLNGGKGDNVISNSAGKNVSISGGADNDKIYNGAIYGYGSGTVGAYTLSPDKVTINALGGDDTITNQGSNVKIDGGAGNDSITNVILKEWTGRIITSPVNVTINTGAGDDTVTNEGENTLFIFSGGNDVIQGFNATSTLQIGDGTATYSKANIDKNIVMTTANGSITLTDAASLNTLNILGEEILPALTFTNDDDDKQTLDNNVESVDATARTKAIRITGNALANTILGGYGKDTLYGKNGDDYLAGDKGNDYLNGQNGADTLYGGTGNDTLIGGNGNDLFIYSAGNDVITDYATGDKISLGASVSSATLNGSNAVFTFNKNTLTVKNVGHSELTLIDKSGKELTTIVSGIIYDDSAAAKVTVPSGIEIVSATTRTEAIKITANKVANSIIGGAGKDTIAAGNGDDTVYGGNGNDSITGGNNDDYLSGDAGSDKLLGNAGNDTLWGGVGNDTLTGGNGADTFIYTGGKDVITDFGSDDLLLITGTFSGTYNKSKNTIAFKVGTTASALTLKDFTTTTFTINGDAYHISGSKLVK